MCVQTMTLSSVRGWPVDQSVESIWPTVWYFFGGRHWQPPGLVFEALQQSQELGGRQRVEGQFEQVRYHFMEGIQSVDDVLSTTRTHVRMISEGADSP
jgi:hypothetical protein